MNIIKETESKTFNLFLFIWSFLFDSWDVKINQEYNEEKIKLKELGFTTYQIKTYRKVIEYKYTHKFFNKEKIVKVYL